MDFMPRNMQKPGATGESIFQTPGKVKWQSGGGTIQGRF
jgi:hypothetical protein